MSKLSTTGLCTRTNVDILRVGVERDVGRGPDTNPRGPNQGLHVWLQLEAHPPDGCAAPAVLC